MIDGLKPYPRMKRSGLPWVEEIPEHWSLLPNRALIRQRKKLVGSRHTEFLLLSLTKQGVIIRDMTQLKGKFSADMGTSQEVRPGDLVFCLFDVPETPRAVGLSRHHGMITSAYTVFEAIGASSKEFFEAFYLAMDDQKLLSPLYSGLRQTIPPSVFLQTKTPVPPADEQTAIVRFIDHADRRIRRYIHAKQKLIKLLGEHKQTIIHRAVTRGLDPNVRLKPSGVEWLGDVPKHWQVRRVKQLARVLRGKFTHRPRNDPSLYDGPYPFIQTGDVARARKEVTEHRQTLNERGLAVSTLFPAGTLVMTIAANIGDVAVLDFDACFPDSVVGFVPHAELARDFLYYVFRAMKPELLQEAPVNTQGNLNVDRIGSRAIALPPYGEQVSIVETIEADTGDLSAAQHRARREVDLLREYRTRLIADVVTGKVDVREAAMRLPELEGAVQNVEVEAQTEADPADEELDAEPAETEA
jgi:type I restriction enzyme, S subunit